MSSADILSRLLSAHEAEKDVAGTDSGIDFSDIPELTDDQLRRAKRVRVGRPPLGAAPRKAISIKLDPVLLEKLKKRAAHQRSGYQTLIHRILEEYLRNSSAA